NPIDDAPIAQNDSYETGKNVTLIANVAFGVLADDSDVDTGDTLIAQLNSGPTHGDLTLNPDGSFTYVPDIEYLGFDSFTYFAVDSTNLQDQATVTIEVTGTPNNPPIAVNDAYEVEQDSVLEVDFANGVLSNDTDADNNPLDVSAHTDPTHGTLDINIDGSFTYTPNAGYVGQDTFNYTVVDGQTGSDVGLVTITVNPLPVPHAPVTVDDAYDTPFNTQLVINAPGVLTNDSDADDDPITVSSHTDPANGVLVINADGSFTYTPNPTFSGDDTFTYVITDGTLFSDPPATVTITVGEPPLNPTDLLVNGGFETDEDTDKVPDGWTGKNLTKEKIRCDTEDKIYAYEGVCAFQFKGVPGENSNLMQIPDGSALVTGDTLSLYAAVNGKKAVEGRARVIAKVIYADQKVKLVLNVPSGKYDYQILNDTDTLPGTPTKIKVQIQYRRGGNTGKFIIDQVRLLVNEGSTAFTFAGASGADSLIGLPAPQVPVPSPSLSGNGNSSGQVQLGSNSSK
ncbi:MAG TPA: Ig-like domain-containing protein, partial [Phototrophicaceae bacterium]|nr:Ig-like domain-containing protein [Phototrophicaceae bacterium]